MQANKNAPADGPGQARAATNKQVHNIIKSDLKQPEIVFVEGKICPFCRLGHLQQHYYYYTTDGRYYNTKKCSRCGFEHGYYSDEFVGGIRKRPVFKVIEIPKGFRLDHGMRGLKCLSL